MNLEPLSLGEFSDWNLGKPLDNLYLRVKVLREGELAEVCRLASGWRFLTHG